MQAEAFTLGDKAMVSARPISLTGDVALTIGRAVPRPMGDLGTSEWGIADAAGGEASASWWCLFDKPHQLAPQRDQNGERVGRGPRTLPRTLRTLRAALGAVALVRHETKVECVRAAQAGAEHWERWTRRAFPQSPSPVLFRRFETRVRAELPGLRVVRRLERSGTVAAGTSADRCKPRCAQAALTGSVCAPFRTVDGMVGHLLRRQSRTVGRAVGHTPPPVRGNHAPSIPNCC